MPEGARRSPKEPGGARRSPKEPERPGRAENRGHQWPGPPRPLAGDLRGLAARLPLRRRPRRRATAGFSVPHASRRLQSRGAEPARPQWRLLCGGFGARPPPANAGARPGACGVGLRRVRGCSGLTSRLRYVPVLGGKARRSARSTWPMATGGSHVLGSKAPQLAAPSDRGHVENYRHKPWKLEYSNAGILTDLSQLCSLQHTHASNEVRYSYFTCSSHVSSAGQPWQ
ncbi:putative uncharacterized protein DANCR isoform X1 [Felis catus]|uniref:putative uncharacterized protein DANCR isoform X1 n=1 Tax=Felis catus TaxID=9685 RepID=UPI001D19D6CB|nr:putative uncharacterized protein DANCR isoform X1 [Felis catus]